MVNEGAGGHGTANSYWGGLAAYATMKKIRSFGGEAIEVLKSAPFPHTILLAYC